MQKKKKKKKTQLEEREERRRGGGGCRTGQARWGTTFYQTLLEVIVVFSLRFNLVYSPESLKDLICQPFEMEENLTNFLKSCETHWGTIKFSSNFSLI